MDTRTMATKRTRCLRSCIACRKAKQRCILPDPTASSKRPLPASQACGRCTSLRRPCVVVDNAPTAQANKKSKREGSAATEDKEETLPIFDPFADSARESHWWQSLKCNYLQPYSFLGQLCGHYELDAPQQTDGIDQILSAAQIDWTALQQSLDSLRHSAPFIPRHLQALRQESEHRTASSSSSSFFAFDRDGLHPQSSLLMGVCCYLCGDERLSRSLEPVIRRRTIQVLLSSPKEADAGDVASLVLLALFAPLLLAPSASVDGAGLILAAEARARRLGMHRSQEYKKLWLTIVANVALANLATDPAHSLVLDSALEGELVADDQSQEAFVFRSRLFFRVQEIVCKHISSITDKQQPGRPLDVIQDSFQSAIDELRQDHDETINEMRDVLINEEHPYSLLHFDLLLAQMLALTQLLRLVMVQMSPLIDHCAHSGAFLDAVVQDASMLNLLVTVEKPRLNIAKQLSMLLTDLMRNGTVLPPAHVCASALLAAGALTENVAARLRIDSFKGVRLLSDPYEEPVGQTVQHLNSNLADALSTCHRGQSGTLFQTTANIAQKLADATGRWLEQTRTMQSSMSPTLSWPFTGFDELFSTDFLFPPS